jgi:hypothetical protein
VSELNAQQAMEQAVHHARAQLVNGALVQGTLEHLWRIAFAAGVRAGQQAMLSPAIHEPLRSELQAKIAARADGWKYGASNPLDRKPGVRFIYGGTDPEKPVCERQATVMAPQSGRNWMLLDDTQERVRIPALCWWRPVAEEVAADGAGEMGTSAGSV